LIPISLLLGFIMLRTDNIAAPAIYHTFADWVGIFY
jgi:membrane protease YdiL (CAAX protease family)